MGKQVITLTPLQTQLEGALGQPIRQIVIDAIRAERSVRQAARRLSVSRITLRSWINELDIDAEAEIARAILDERVA